MGQVFAQCLDITLGTCVAVMRVVNIELDMVQGNPESRTVAGFDCGAQMMQQ